MKILLVLLFALVSSADQNADRKKYELQRRRREFVAKRRSKQISMDIIKDKLHSNVVTGMIPTTNIQMFMSKFDELMCPVCRGSVNSVLPFINYDWGVNSLLWSLKRICIEFNIFDDYICQGTIDSFRQVFVELIRRKRPDARSVCNMVVKDCYPKWAFFTTFNWSEMDLPPATNDNSYQFPTTQRKTLKVLHITDVHIDVEYEAGTNAVCNQPLCCRNTSDGVHDSPKSFYWGTRYSCDIPFRTFEAALMAAKQVLPDPDLIFWTGDVPAHDIWDYSQHATQNLMTNVTDHFVKYFPGVKILPTLGNHEGVPINQYGTSENWLYDAIASEWSKFNLDPNSFETIKMHGYYTELIYPGHRIIAINSNFCMDMNYMILLGTGDPGNQHQWLIDTLQSAEDNNEAVLLLGHIPPGEPDQIDFCSIQFYKIINRYQNTIRAQFYGHTHWDHLRVFYEDFDPTKKATNVAYVTPSVTTWVGMDPAFRVYEIDHWDNPNPTFTVLDHHTYTTDVHNDENERLVWSKEYSARDEYGLVNLSAPAWAHMIDNWSHSESLDTFTKYFRNKYHHNLNVTCDEQCRENVVCLINNAAKLSNTPICDSSTT